VLWFGACTETVEDPNDEVAHHGGDAGITRKDVDALETVDSSRFRINQNPQVATTK
jgi:hypothetical protein